MTCPRISPSFPFKKADLKERGTRSLGTSWANRNYRTFTEMQPLATTEIDFCWFFNRLG